MSQPTALPTDAFISPIALQTTEAHPMGSGATVTVHSATWAAEMAARGQYQLAESGPVKEKR